MTRSTPGEFLPDAEERRLILERAGRVLEQARALCEDLDKTEGALTWSVEARIDAAALVAEQNAPVLHARITI